MSGHVFKHALFHKRYGEAMKKVFYIISDLLIAALLAGAYVLQYFAKRKLGMNRWIIFKMSKIKEMLPIEPLRYAAVAAVLVLTVLLVVNYGRSRRQYGKMILPMVIFTVVLGVFYLGFTIYFSQESLRSYYLALPLIGLANVVQLAKTFAAMKLCRHRES